jgi:hypothetical protein
MTFLLQIKLYKTKGLKRFRRWCGGRPRPFRGGGRGVRRAGCGWDSRPGNPPLLRKIHQPSKIHFSLRYPFLMWLRSTCPDATRGLDAGTILMCCWFVNGEFRGRGGNGYTLGYGFGSLWTGVGNWSAFGCEDDGVCGGCSDSSESVGGCAGGPECCGSGFDSHSKCGFGFGFREGKATGPAGTAGRAYDGSGAADGARAERGEQTVWRGGVEPLG